MVQTVLRTLVSAITVHCQVVDVLFVLVLWVPQVQFLDGSAAPLWLRECLRRDVVWWWRFHSCWCLRFRLGQREADDWKLHYQLFPVPRGRWVCLHVECLVQQQRRNLR